MIPFTHFVLETFTLNTWLIVTFYASDPTLLCGCRKEDFGAPTELVVKGGPRRGNGACQGPACLELASVRSAHVALGGARRLACPALSSEVSR